MQAGDARPDQLSGLLLFGGIREAVQDLRRRLVVHPLGAQLATQRRLRQRPRLLFGTHEYLGIGRVVDQTHLGESIEDLPRDLRDALAFG